MTRAQSRDERVESGFGGRSVQVAGGACAAQFGDQCAGGLAGQLLAEVLLESTAYDGVFGFWERELRGDPVPGECDQRAEHREEDGCAVRRGLVRGGLKRGSSDRLFNEVRPGRLVRAGAEPRRQLFSEG